MSPHDTKRPTWPHQDALVQTVKAIVTDGGGEDRLDLFIQQALSEPRAAYKSLCGCITHHLLQRARRQQRLLLLRLLSRVCEQACAALGPGNVFGATCVMRSHLVSQPRTACLTHSMCQLSV